VRPALALLAAVAFLGIAPSAPAVFPGANGLVLFTSDRSGQGDVFAVKPDGTGLRTLVGGPEREAQAAWSPDGRMVAFRRGPSHASDVWVANADGSGERRLTTSPAGRYSSQPAWSPDGRIVFRSDRDGDPDTWVMNADGSGQRVLLDLPGNQSYPTPSPDGRRIAYRSDADGDAEIWVADIDGAAPRALTANVLIDDSAPSWSPDGGRLAFERVAGGNTDVYVMDDQGAAETRLTDGSALDEGPVFSPDGRSIVFTTERDGGNSEIYVMRADGSDQHALSPSPAKEESPDWQAVGGPVAREPAVITLRVSPRRVTEDRIATLRFTARAERSGRIEPVAGATVRFGGLHATTDAQGRTTIRKLMRHPGLFTARASLRGHRSGVARVRVRRRSA
jgi:TolB protein